VPHLPNREALEVLSRARALLFPLDWEEPFGLTVIEAMAAGTPVVTLRRGAMPELVEHGVTGFVCDSEEEMAGAVRRVGELDRSACRRRVEERYHAERMLDGYEALYRQLAG
jgi:glycosyltransferase involved in cell wall biosynthesis